MLCVRYAHILPDGPIVTVSGPCVVLGHTSQRVRRRSYYTKFWEGQAIRLRIRPDYETTEKCKWQGGVTECTREDQTIPVLSTDFEDHRFIIFDIFATLRW